ncbi:MAG: ThuA domain-containing protein [Thermoguttaceae bacterium]|nr:ThuA domain-containing protein [Thermoguttaceae bacterium]MDW8078842.1 ThuA domain-containing protein [Thermoguttaceae bacterium]
MLVPTHRRNPCELCVFYRWVPISLVLPAILLGLPAWGAEDLWVTYRGTEGPGAGKQIVLIAGDEEYRSEEYMPMLGQILAKWHGFTCTVLFSINPETGEIDPNCQTNIPGLDQLRSADLMIIGARFRELPDDQMQYIAEYVDSGKPIIGIRTATHAFAYTRNRQSRFAHYDWRSTVWPGGFGRQVLGETWVSHHGVHGRESTRGVIAPGMSQHPILRGVKDVWGPTDVYTVRDLPKDAQVLLYGQVLSGMNPDDPPVAGPKNDPMMPLAWIRFYPSASGKKARVFCTTMGSAVDFACEDLRRLVVNAAYWCLGMEDLIPERAKVDYVTPYEPTPFGFGKFRPGKRPPDLAWR